MTSRSSSGSTATWPRAGSTSGGTASDARPGTHVPARDPRRDHRRDRLVLVVGPKAVTSDYVRAEWLYALEIGKAINPVLRLGDYDLLPDELKLLDAPDFRDDGHYPARLETLVRQLSEPVAPMGKLIAVPSLPPHFLRRQDRLRALKDAVLADLHRPVVITGTAARARASTAWAGSASRSWPPRSRATTRCAGRFPTACSGWASASNRRS